MAPVRAPATSARDYLPEQITLDVLREASQGCKGCDLYLNATQTIFGEGRKGAEILFVGEQPGDQEDLAGKPFVGPAGKLLDTCMAAAGIDRSTAYITNAVKHFKREPRGKRRIHKKPIVRGVGACRPWLEAEIAAVKARLIVCLGATATQYLLGNAFRVIQERGRLQSLLGYPPILATIHLSSRLRAPDEEAKQQETKLFVADLKVVTGFLQTSR